MDSTAAAPVNAIAFGIGCVYTFLLFSHASEFIDDHGRMHLVILSAALAIMALISTGNGPRMLATIQGKWLTAFISWLFLGLPFSMWKGGSFAMFKDACIKSYIAFFLVGGLIFSLAQIRKVFFWLGLGTCVIVFLAFHAGSTARWATRTIWLRRC
jgi:hypothetical protein